MAGREGWKATPTVMHVTVWWVPGEWSPDPAARPYVARVLGAPLTAQTKRWTVELVELWPPLPFGRNQARSWRGLVRAITEGLEAMAGMPVRGVRPSIVVDAERPVDP